jgi:dTMP kinase
LFVTIEGIEGSGKTTQVELLGKALAAIGRRPRTTREPGGTPAGARIRELLLHGRESIGAWTELFLILADRAEHVSALIRPALERGEDVLCDRFSESTLAYQAYGRGLPVETVRSAESAARQGLEPDLTIVLDCPVAIGLERTRLRRGAVDADRFESEAVSFHERVHEGFLALATLAPARIVVLDGRRDEAHVHGEIVRAVRARIEAAGAVR